MWYIWALLYCCFFSAQQCCLSHSMLLQCRHCVNAIVECYSLCVTSTTDWDCICRAACVAYHLSAGVVQCILVYSSGCLWLSVSSSLRVWYCHGCAVHCLLAWPAEGGYLLHIPFASWLTLTYSVSRHWLCSCVISAHAFGIARLLHIYHTNWADSYACAALFADFTCLG